MDKKLKKYLGEVFNRPKAVITPHPRRLDEIHTFSDGQNGRIIGSWYHPGGGGYIIERADGAVRQTQAGIFS